jgi:hypothetical protein
VNRNAIRIGATIAVAVALIVTLTLVLTGGPKDGKFSGCVA